MTIRECSLDDPYVVNVDSDQAKELSSVTTQYSRVLIKVRDMGSAVTVKIGTARHREITLKEEGEVIPLSAPGCQYYDLSKLRVEADGDGVVLEVWGTLL